MTSNLFLELFGTQALSDDERFYFRYVDRMISQNRDEWLSNAKPAHAVYIMARFFDHACETIRIFTGNLKTHQDDFPVWGNAGVIAAAKRFLGNPGTQLLVVTEESDLDAESTESHPLIAALIKFADSDEAKGRAVVATAHANAIKFLNDHDACRHFMLMDNTAIRLETDPEKTQAHVNFGNEKFADGYADLFDKVLFGMGYQKLVIN